MKRTMNGSMRRGAAWKGVIGALAIAGLIAGCSSTPAEKDTGTSDGAPREVDSPIPQFLTDRGHLVVGVKCDYPPFGYVEADGSNAGYEILLSKGFAEYAFGDPEAVEFECVSAANRVSMLTNGRVDMLIATMGKTPEREEVMAFSERPYFLSGHSMLVEGETDITGWDDLEGDTVISLTGSTGTQVLNECFTGIDVQEYESASDSLTALGQDRGSVFVYDTAFFAGLVMNSDKYKLVGDSIGPSASGIGMNPGDEELHAWVDAVIDDLTAEDRLWEFFIESADDEDVQKAFTDYIPRTGAPLSYLEGSPWEIC